METCNAQVSEAMLHTENTEHVLTSEELHALIVRILNEGIENMQACDLRSAWEFMSYDLFTIAWLGSIAFTNRGSTKGAVMDDGTSKKMVNITLWSIHVCEIARRIDLYDLVSKVPQLENIKLVLSRLDLMAYLALRTSKAQNRFYTFFVHSGRLNDIHQEVIKVTGPVYAAFLLQAYRSAQHHIDYSIFITFPTALIQVIELDKFWPQLDKSYQPVKLTAALNGLAKLEQPAENRDNRGSGQPRPQGGKRGPTNGQNNGKRKFNKFPKSKGKKSSKNKASKKERPNGTAGSMFNFQ